MQCGLVCVFLHAGIAQFQSCHDSTGCGENELTGVNTAEECCLGSGLSFRDSGTCRQCIGKQSPGAGLDSVYYTSYSHFSTKRYDLAILLIEL